MKICRHSKSILDPKWKNDKIRIHMLLLYNCVSRFIWESVESQKNQFTEKKSSAMVIWIYYSNNLKINIMNIRRWKMQKNSVTKYIAEDIESQAQ